MNRMGILLLLLSVLLVGLAFTHAQTISSSTIPQQQTGSYCSSTNAQGTAGTVEAEAPWYCTQIDQALAYYWSGWAPIALLAVMAAFCIATMIWGAGILLRSERIRTFAVGEFYEAIASALIVILFLFISAVMFGLIPGLTVGNINPYNTALQYMSQTTTSLHTEILQLFNVTAVDGFYTSIGLKFSIAGVSPVTNFALNNFIPALFSYTVGYLFYVPAVTILEMQLDMIGIIYAEMWALIFFMYIAIPVFLIPGVILRTLIPTRAMGGMMIAIAIGFYMVLPLLFSIAYYFTHTQTIQCISSASNAVVTFGSGVGAQTNALQSTSPLVQEVAANGPLQSCMSQYWMSVLFYPALIFALVYATIVQISDFIGGMAQMSSRLRL